MALGGSDEVVMMAMRFRDRLQRAKDKDKQGVLFLPDTDLIDTSSPDKANTFRNTYLNDLLQIDAKFLNNLEAMLLALRRCLPQIKDENTGKLLTLEYDQISSLFKDYEVAFDLMCQDPDPNQWVDKITSIQNQILILIQMGNLISMMTFDEAFLESFKKVIVAMRGEMSKLGVSLQDQISLEGLQAYATKPFTRTSKYSITLDALLKQLDATHNTKYRTAKQKADKLVAYANENHSNYDSSLQGWADPLMRETHARAIRQAADKIKDAKMDEKEHYAKLTIDQIGSRKLPPEVLNEILIPYLKNKDFNKSFQKGLEAKIKIFNNLIELKSDQEKISSQIMIAKMQADAAKKPGITRMQQAMKAQLDKETDPEKRAAIEKSLKELAGPLPSQIDQLEKLSKQIAEKVTEVSQQITGEERDKQIDRLKSTHEYLCALKSSPTLISVTSAASPSASRTPSPSPSRTPSPSLSPSTSPRQSGSLPKSRSSVSFGSFLSIKKSDSSPELPGGSRSSSPGGSQSPKDADSASRSSSPQGSQIKGKSHK